MAWTSPRTWVVSEVVTASILNTHLRDNLLETVPAKATAVGQIPYASGVNSIAMLASAAAYGLLMAQGVGVAPIYFAKGPSTNSVLHTNTGGALEWKAVDLLGQYNASGSVTVGAGTYLIIATAVYTFGSDARTLTIDNATCNVSRGEGEDCTLTCIGIGTGPNTFIAAHTGTGAESLSIWAFRIA